MLAAWLVRRLELSGHLRRLVPPLLYVVGYGPLLTAMTAAAYIKELQRGRDEVGQDREDRPGRGADVSESVPGAEEPPDPAAAELERSLDLDEERGVLRRVETWIFLRGVIILLFVIAVIILRSRLL